MTKNIFLSLLLLTFVLSVFGQSSGQSKNILDKASALYTNSKGVSFDFTITASDTKGNKHPPQRGKAIAKGNKFKIDFETSTVWFDGKTQWVLIKELKEVNISNPVGEEIASVSPLSLLNSYKSGYALSTPTTKTVRGRNAHLITLTPTGNKGDYREITVSVDKANSAILQVGFILKNGTKNQIELSNYNTNYNFSDSEFVFSKDQHKGIEVVDLR